MTDYKPGSYFLTKISGPVGWAINVGQALCGDGSRWSHAGLILDESGTILEAEPGGARISNLSEYAGRPLLISDAPVQRRMAGMVGATAFNHPVNCNACASSEKRIRDGITAEARKLVGVPYSGLDYAALAALHLHLPSAWIRRRVESSGHLICSALVDRAYMNAGIHLFDDKPYKHRPDLPRYVGDVMPADLAAFAEDWQAAQ